MEKEEEDAIENDPILKKLRASSTREFLSKVRSLTCCLLYPDLLTTKAFCVFLYGASGALLPYLPLYFKQFGFKAYQVGIILGIGPIIQCLAAPVWVIFAKKWKIEKFVFLSGILSWLVKALLILAVRPRAQTCMQVYTNATTNITYMHTYPRWGHHEKGASIKWSFVLPKPSTQKPTHKPTHKQFSNISIVNSSASSNSSHEGAVVLPKPSTQKPTHKPTHKPTYKPTHKQFSNISIVNSSASLNTSHETKREFLKELDYPFPDADAKEQQARDDYWNDENDDSFYKSRHLMESFSDSKAAFSSQAENKNKFQVTQFQTFDSNRNMTFKYIIKIDQEELYDLFFIFLLFVVIADFLQAPTFLLADASLLNRLKEEHRQSPTKLWTSGSLGWVISVMVVGIIIYDSAFQMCGAPRSLYYIAFYFYIGFVCMAVVNSLWFQFTSEEDRKNYKSTESLRNSCSFFCNIRDGTFLACVLYVGMCYGFLAHFLNWYIDDMNGNTLIMGTASAVRELTALAFFLTGGTFLPVLGHVNILAFSLLCYSVCFFCYWLVMDLWVVVAIGALEGATFASLWRCCERYFTDLGTPTRTSRIMQNVLQAIYWGLGNGGGAMIGGYLYHWLGAKKTFLTLGVSSIVVLVVFMLVDYVEGELKNEDTEKNEYASLDGEQPDENREIEAGSHPHNEDNQSAAE